MNKELETIPLEQDGRVATITLNRPDKLNAINDTMLTELKETLDRLAGDENIRVVVIKGAGRAFSAGQTMSLTCHYAGHLNVQYVRFRPDEVNFYRVRRDRKGLKGFIDERARAHLGAPPRKENPSPLMGFASNVIPAKAGIQVGRCILMPGGDINGYFWGKTPLMGEDSFYAGKYRE